MRSTLGANQLRPLGPPTFSPTAPGIVSASTTSANGSMVPSSRNGGLVEPVPGGALGPVGHVVLPRRVAQRRRPSTRSLPERHRVEVGSTPGGSGSRNDGQSAGGRTSGGGSRSVNSKPRREAPKMPVVRWPTAASAVADLGPQVRHRPAAAQDLDVDVDRARGRPGRRRWCAGCAGAARDRRARRPSPGGPAPSTTRPGAAAAGSRPRRSRPGSGRRRRGSTAVPSRKGLPTSGTIAGAAYGAQPDCALPDCAQAACAVRTA